ncbi:MAG: hypothetical protein HY816_20215 [Candidatus Wallbacteria bacterium]|nr:hypothetical protein [Candidatus Wallbacteria bacterium]
MSFWAKYSEEFSTLLRTVLSTFASASDRTIKWVAEQIHLPSTTLEKAARGAATFPPLYLVPLFRVTGDRRVLDSVLAPHGIAWFDTTDAGQDSTATRATPSAAISRRLLELESAAWTLRARCLEIAAGMVPHERGCVVEETNRLALATMAAVRALHLAAAASIECRCRQAGEDRSNLRLVVAEEATSHYSSGPVEPAPPSPWMTPTCERCGAACSPDDHRVRVTMLGTYCTEVCALADWRQYRETKERLKAAGDGERAS